MSRYIDADALMQKLDIKADCKECNSIDHFLCCLRSRDFVNACEAINDAPSIDIVRCGECKHCSKDRIKWSVKDEGGNWIDTKCNLCRRTKLEVNLDDFCSYGEREGEVIESKGCVTCKHTDKEWYEEPCEDCHGNSGYERKESE